MSSNHALTVLDYQIAMVRTRAKGPACLGITALQAHGSKLNTHAIQDLMVPILQAFSLPAVTAVQLGRTARFPALLH